MLPEVQAESEMARRRMVERMCEVLCFIAPGLYSLNSFAMLFSENRERFKQDANQPNRVRRAHRENQRESSLYILLWKIVTAHPHPPTPLPMGEGSEMSLFRENRFDNDLEGAETISHKSDY